MSDTFNITKYRQNVGTKIKEVDEFILSGRCQDYASYRFKVGERTGMRDALQSIVETLKQMGNEDDD